MWSSVIDEGPLFSINVASVRALLAASAKILSLKGFVRPVSFLEMILDIRKFDIDKQYTITDNVNNSVYIVLGVVILMRMQTNIYIYIYFRKK